MGSTSKFIVASPATAASPIVADAVCASAFRVDSQRRRSRGDPSVVSHRSPAVSVVSVHIHASAKWDGALASTPRRRMRHVRSALRLQRPSARRRRRKFSPPAEKPEPCRMTSYLVRRGCASRSSRQRSPPVGAFGTRPARRSPAAVVGTVRSPIPILPTHILSMFRSALSQC